MVPQGRSLINDYKAKQPYKTNIIEIRHQEELVIITEGARRYNAVGSSSHVSYVHAYYVLVVVLYSCQDEIDQKVDQSKRSQL